MNFPPVRVVAWLAASTLAAWALALLFALVATPARAEETGLSGDLEQQVRQLAQDGSRMPGAPRIEVTLGQLDPRLRLAPCLRIEPYLPSGVRLWGRSRIGLRCLEGTVKWNVYLPVTVKVYGNALVVPGGAAVGTILGPADVVEAEVDLAEDNSPVLTDANLAIGHAVARTLKPGQSVRQADLRPRQWFAAGDTVKVIAQGAGFTVSGEGQALTSGLEGQTARVRTESGRIVTGTASGDHQIVLPL
ncbi:MAG: flagellar basal body P-ring formation protein FlgA [Proteobacteria bacterium]|nr:flagellar basal body P-ring formation protein FlgA [Pseudomonadota bacterium]